jgi:hypothetical protein
MVPTLSSQASLEHFEQQARDLLHDLRRKDPAAVRRYFSFDPLAGNFQPGLADAKYVIARQYGCRSWQELRRHLLSNINELPTRDLWNSPAA